MHATNVVAILTQSAVIFQTVNVCATHQHRSICSHANWSVLMYSKVNCGSTAATRVAAHYDVMYALTRFAFMFYQYVNECANCSEMLSFHVWALSVSPIAPGQSLNEQWFSLKSISTSRQSCLHSWCLILQRHREQQLRWHLLHGKCGFTQVREHGQQSCNGAKQIIQPVCKSQALVKLLTQYHVMQTLTSQILKLAVTSLQGCWHIGKQKQHAFSSFVVWHNWLICLGLLHLSSPLCWTFSNLPFCRHLRCPGCLQYQGTSTISSLYRAWACMESKNKFAVLKATHSLPICGSV